MGKGKRNRERRKQAIDPAEVIDRLLDIEDRDEFLALIDDLPAALDNAVLARLSQMAAAPPGLVFKRWERLLIAARSDPGEAWEEHVRTLARDEETAERLAGVLQEILEAERQREPVRAVELADVAIPQALEAELAPAVASFEAARAHGYLVRPDGNRADNVDKAISGFGRALTTTIDPEEAARMHMHIAIAMAERVRGDPADNLEAGMNALRQALEILPPEASADMRTAIQTNLASALLRRERGEKIENLTEALELCREVLEYRSTRRDPNEWAYIQLNYAPTLQQLADLGEVDRAEAEAAYREVIEAGALIDDRHLANAHYQLGRMHRIGAEFDPEQFVEDWDPDERGEEAQEAEKAETERTLSEAREHLEAAAGLYDPERDPIPSGRAYAELADVLNRLERFEESTEAARRGLELLPPMSAPREAARVGGRLGDLLSRQGEWEQAAAAFRVAVEAAELAFHSRLDADSREREASSTINLTRWAAFAIAAAGDTPEAMMVLESGRSRDMRQRLGLGKAAARELAELPDELRLRYVEATDELARSPLGEAGAAASRRLQETLRDIREVSGFEEFATRANPSDLLGALEPDWPLLYVNPTPYGTLLLLVEQAGEEATVDALFLDEPTSLEVLMRLLAGDAAGSPELLESAEYGSFLSGASGFSGAERDVQKDVEHVLPWFGEAFAKPIKEVLSGIGARGVTLVCCGPVGLAPLHAAPWEGEGATCYLIDDFEIRYAPSGAFAASSLSRAAERDGLEPSLIALADPQGNLPAAQPEVEVLSRHFDGRVSLAAGAEASWFYLRAHAAEGTHLHLACHARAGVWGEDLSAVIILADGPVDVTQLTELAELPSRLVTVSACQSAVVSISHMPEEAISVGSVLLASGAACVIASLWPVRDDTTALLMTRLYEEMIERNLRPPEALRQAQLWLRALTDAEVDAYLAQHPALEREFRRRAALGDRPGKRTSGARRGAGSGVEHPFSGPDYWAPFIAAGA